MHHSLLGVQQTGDSKDNSWLFISWVGEPCLNKTDNSSWENSGKSLSFKAEVKFQKQNRPYVINTPHLKEKSPVLAMPFC